jgi:cytochrome P450
MTVDLPEFPMARTAPFDPPSEYAELGANGPVSRAVLPTGQPVWLITGHEHVRKVLVDPRVSSDRRNDGFPALVEVTEEMRRRTSAITTSLIGSDPPEHTDQRRMLITEFTVRRVQALRPRIQEIVDERVDAMLAGDQPADLFADLALPVPSLVICELLGVPYEDRAFFQSRSRKLLSRNSSAAEREACSEELRAYFDKLITAKKAAPGDDLLGRLIERNTDTEVFTHEMLVGLATLLLIAGHETTSNSVEAGFRVALDDIEIDGTVIKAGEGLVALAASANRDSAAFEQPDGFDVARGARHHVAFGYGIHQCLGQNLARMELEIVFGTLFRRIPGLRLSIPLSDVPFKKDAFIYGVDALPVTW